MEDRYATVLVAVLKSPRDLRLAQEEGWYRIPLRHMPARGKEARYIAFYQPRSFGAEGGAIRYVAPVLGWEVARRRELLPEEGDHPRADDLYFRVRLGMLRPLPVPIRSGRWRRFAFILTHWGRLFQAGEVRELVHGTRWEESLWRALRRAGLLA
ncbi:MAG: hypothetical protein ACP5OO_01890 [Chloroflexia bacterium]